MASKENKKVEIDYNVKEIIDNLDKSVVLTPEDKKRIEQSLDFDSAVENIDISNNDNRVIFTDGENQLVFENGEFFLVSSTDSLKNKIKKKREDARNMYIEYFIKYQLNPILKQKELNEMARTISTDEPLKTKKKESVKKELGNNVKSAPDHESNSLKSRSKQIQPKQKSR